DRKDNKPKPVTNFTAKIDRSTLADAGQGFVLPRRGMNKRPAPELDEEAVKDVVQREEARKDKKALSISQSQEKLVELKMYYNDREQKIGPDPDHPGEDRFTVADPKQGAKVYFTIENITDERVAVVLKVNGMNTLDRELDEAEKCSKWV